MVEGAYHTQGVNKNSNGSDYAFMMSGLSQIDTSKTHKASQINNSTTKPKISKSSDKNSGKQNY